MPATGAPQVAYSPQQLQQLWVSNGGDPKAAPMAAAIALAESSGRPDAINHNTNGTVDRGAWQINSIHGALSSFDPVANVKAAIQISNNGTNWSPWTTYNTGAYKQYLGQATKVPSVSGAVQAGTGPGTVRPVAQVAAAQPKLDPARAAALKSLLGPLDSGMGPAVQNALFSKAQENLLGAHKDLQTLAGTTTLNVHPASGEAGGRVAAMVKAADALVGKPYVWGGGHNGWGPQPGYDCSGFVSAVLHAGGFLGAPQTTQTLPSEPGIANGPGKFVTVYDRTDGGSPNNDHVIIDINGAWYESGGQQGPWGGGGGVQRIQKPSAEYLSSFNRALHPLGL